VIDLKTLQEYGVYNITPIEEHRGIFYKRDDYYQPFEDVPLSGGKVRQALNLIHDNYRYIKNECNGIIATGTSVNSPQGIIVARVAKEFGFQSLLIVGATKKETLLTNPLIVNAINLGAKVDLKSKLGYDSTLTARINELEKNLKFFVVKFGINLDTNPNAIIDSIALQVQNLPTDLDVLIVPVGSAITFGGILKGLIKYNIKPKRVIGVQIAGYDRTDVVNRILDQDTIDYEFYPDKTYAYSKHLTLFFNDREFLDKIYEAKAYDFMMRNIDVKNNKVLFWIVGDSTLARKLWL
jgi:1-aminocyclopropane-1-carboxylate deaminase/D-cysteine desulfhydrase-like pyridoxal-dependent ACC family enzyme